MNSFKPTFFCRTLFLGVLFWGACDQDQGFLDVTGEGGAWEDPNTGLMWQILPSDEFVSWIAAIEHCDALLLDGYDDWRLPTISELRSLIVGCDGTIIGGTCEVSDDCYGDRCSSEECYSCDSEDSPIETCFSVPELHSPCEHYWSSTPVSEYANRAWAVGFSSGFIYKPRTVYSFHARCVR